NNSWIRALQRSVALKREARKLNQSWSGRTQEVKIWSRDIVSQEPEYQANLDRKELSYSEQKKFANHFLRRVLLGKNGISDYFEEQVIHWAEDKDIVRGLIEKTVKSFDPAKQEEISLHALSLNWEEDKDFVERLYNETLYLAKP